MVTTPDRGRRFIAILTNELYALAVGAAVSHAELHARAFCGGGGGGVTRSPADLHTTRLPADSPTAHGGRPAERAGPAT